MKWQFLIIGFMVCLCVSSVGALRLNFQDYSANGLSVSSANAFTIDSTLGTPANAGVIDLLCSLTGIQYFINTNPVTFTYARFVKWRTGYGAEQAITYDYLGNIQGGLSYGGEGIPPGTYEYKIVGTTLYIFKDGTLFATSGYSYTINPSYLKFTTILDYYYDNILIGESDHHLVGALPSNWSIQRDLINPAATGVYAWNNGTSSWVLKNSNYFYIDADTDSTLGLGIENFKIYNYDYGFIVNTTTVNSATPHHQIQYNVTQFLLSTNPVSASGIPDGHYYAAFEHSTDGGISQARGDFWVISSGASINWNQNSYAQDDAATIAYGVSAGYWDTATYSYRVDVVDITGNVKKTQLVNTQTGNVQISDLTSTTYPQGVYYAEIIATSKADSVDHVMNYAAMSVTGYIYFNGYVMNATSGAVISGANVNITESTSSLSSTTSTAGYWTNSNNWLSGSTITINSTYTGYTPDLISITPLTARTINLNISLMPSPATYSGVSIGGIVRDNVYSNPIPAALVVVRNTTVNQYQNALTNIAGYYRADGLYGGYLYDIWSSKTGYTNSTLVKKLAVGS